MRIYAGNIAPATTDAELREAFATHGTVEFCRLATDKETGKPKGFGFVEMPNDTEAAAAIGALNATQLGGNEIKVNEAKPKPEGAKADTASAKA